MNIDNLSQAYEIYRDDPKGHTFRTVTIERGGIICEGEFTQVFSALADEFKIPPEVLETYHGLATLEYDLSAEEWKTPPYIPTPQTWDTLIANRNNMLEGSDSKISPDMPDSVKAPWVAYRTALRDLPATYRKGESDEVEPWKVPIPQAPDHKG